MAQRTRRTSADRNATAHGTTPTIARHLRRLARGTRELELETLADTGVTRAQAHVLIAIGHMGQPAMAMLARALELAPSTLTRLVDPLVRQGLLERQPSPDDRRVIVLLLTAAGKRTLRRVEASLDTAHARVVAHIPRSEHAPVSRALQLVLEAIDRARLEID